MAGDKVASNRSSGRLGLDPEIGTRAVRHVIIGCMAGRWREYEYPQHKSLERVSAGTDRCQSAGLVRVQRLEKLVTGGLIRDPLTGNPLSTPGVDLPGAWIFAVKDGMLRLAPDAGSRWAPGGLPADAIKHETLFSNQPVSAAGEIFIEEGIVVGVNNSSGSYNCQRDDHFVAAFLEALQEAGARITRDLRERLA